MPQPHARRALTSSPIHAIPASARARSPTRPPDTGREPRPTERGALPDAPGAARPRARGFTASPVLPTAERALHAGALASPTHTGEGAEGRREGGEKAAEEGGGRKKIRQRERGEGEK